MWLVFLKMSFYLLDELFLDEYLLILYMFICSGWVFLVICLFIYLGNFGYDKCLKIIIDVGYGYLEWIIEKG